MGDVPDDVVALGLASAMGGMGGMLFRMTQDGTQRTLVCADCGYHGEPLRRGWGRRACGACGGRLLVAADSPMAAGYLESRARHKPLQAGARPDNCTLEPGTS